MYEKLARYWPLISPPDHYIEEGRIWQEAIKRRISKHKPTALDLGTGGGHSLKPLTGYFKATAVDLSSQMLSIAKQLNPDVEHFSGDMRSVRLGKKFDVVLVNDAIGYMSSMPDLEMAIITAKEHLEQGGVLVMGPDWFYETFTDNIFNSFQREDKNIVLTMFEYSFDTDRHDDCYECIYNIVVRESEMVQQFSERHKIGLFSYSQWMDVLARNGFEPEFEEYKVHGDGRLNRLVIGKAL